MAETVSPETQQRILAVAMDEIRRQPVAAVSMDTIARRAGIAKSSVYKAYSTRDELFADASRHVLAAQIEQVAIAVEPSTDPLGALREVLITLFEVGRAQPFAAAYLYGVFSLQFHGHVADHVAEGVRQVERDVHARIRARIGAALDSGQLVGDPVQLTELCMITAFGYIGGSLHHRWSVSPIDLTDAVLRSLRI